MKLPEHSLLKQLASGENPEIAAALDSAGFLAAPGEDHVQYAERVERELTLIEKFTERLSREKVMEPYQGLVVEESSGIPPQYFEDAAGVTDRAYGFAIRHVPGFFPVSGLGLLWGGCSIACEEEIPPLFLIRRSFMTKDRFFIYSRQELMVHELCHAARNPIHDDEYEEHFAYALSSSAFRRATGNCFKSERDALLFLLPVFLLLAVQCLRISYYPNLPVMPFWILIFLWPLYLLWQNRKARIIYFQAKKALTSRTERPDAVLFRCTTQEIRELAQLINLPEKLGQYLEQKKNTDLRWKVIFRRFFREGEIHHGNA